jgi:hypothetical protein
MNASVEVPKARVDMRGRTPCSRWERELSIDCVRIEDVLLNPPLLPWADFWLNPRRLRGSDFLMRWSQGVWSEQRLVEAVNATGRFFAIPYGPSSTAPSDGIRSFELYFERLEAAGLGKIKRPDLLVFAAEFEREAIDLIAQIGGVAELPFTPESDGRIVGLLKQAVLAVECENSLWRARHMPAFGAPLKPQRRLGGMPGLPKNAVLPTIIIKEEDRRPIGEWQRRHRVPVHVWHVFYDMAYGLAFDRAEALVREGVTEPTEQVFQAPGGATTRKIIYKHHYHHGYPLGESVAEPELLPACIEDKNGHILPYVTFRGGRLELAQAAIAELAAALSQRNNR